ncbi:TIGR03885 family FMN-dependent LLM class oxidoreductase [Flavilitoribacter nigricans]|uniref:LLM class F420-dependent oxidoreductase n=1 Tax=Flavilitoribacter nigricans (strain ATCC 23147 / DSM 23189 / NBRC 102662 / NCIMB 1420 / SS-2) TaxID=1122177 RepID=A0A2D0NDT6_FLAN2|nr:TIGR03885 family FMN-dependent LLM class oxidoreductase [Flavilitoribacter nigricans]PHN06645.1 LLM class F420-dependent oxidoreductase [Flavilitoribacter nigricans DSM 23189 = NBRC 102662]
MTAFGYQISHEQFPPSKLLEFAKKAEAAGFDELASSDHLFPWSSDQGHSGFAWSWMAAALEATSLSCGVVNAPVERYHPVIIAQACATLSEMYPERFWPTFGSGEFLNEHITGNHWPEKAARNEQLAEAVSIIKRCWKGERFTHRSKYFTAEEVQVYSLPEKLPPAIGAAITPETAESIGAWADGMYTVWRPHNELKEVIAAFRRGGGEGKPIFLKCDLACAPTHEQAVEEAHKQWRTNVGTSAVHGELRTPEQFEAASQFIGPEEVAQSLRISQDPEQHAEWIRQDMELGVEKIVFHNVTTSQEYFLDFYSKEVFPRVR